MINKNDLSKIANLNDEALKRKLLEITQLTGADSSKISAALSNVDNLRKTISNLSNEDIEKIISAYGKENVRQIQKIISDK